MLSFALSLILAAASLILQIVWHPPASPDVFFFKLKHILNASINGLVLASSGFVLQAVFRNPLVSPFTLGVSSAILFGIVIAVGFSLPATLLGLPAGAILCLLLFLGNMTQRGIYTLLLFGLALNFFFSSLSMLLASFLPYWDLQKIFLWMNGNLSPIDFDPLYLLIILVTWLPLLMLTKKLPYLYFPDDKILTLGVNPYRLRITCTLLSIVPVTLTVAKFGVIGFIGILAPNLARLQPTETTFSKFLNSAIIGITLANFADAFSRYLFFPKALPISATLGIFGAAFLLLWIIRAIPRRMW